MNSVVATIVKAATIDLMTACRDCTINKINNDHGGFKEEEIDIAKQIVLLFKKAAESQCVFLPVAITATIGDK